MHLLLSTNRRQTLNEHRFTAVHNSGVSHWEDLGDPRPPVPAQSPAVQALVRELSEADSEGSTDALVQCYRKVCQVKMVLQNSRQSSLQNVCLYIKICILKKITLKEDVF